MKAIGYQAAVIIAGLILIGWLFQTAPGSASSDMPLILGGIVALCTLLQKQGETDARVEANTAVTEEAKAAAVAAKVVAQEAKTAAVASTVASKENALTLVATSQQQATLMEEQKQTLKGVEHKVDGHLSGIMQEMKDMAKQIARLETDRAVKQAETAQTIAAFAAAIPSAVPPAGATPPYGTPVDGATVVTIDPPEAATITNVPPKGKSPMPGDAQ